VILWVAAISDEVV
jgi:hypothetical protein